MSIRLLIITLILSLFAIACTDPPETGIQARFTVFPPEGDTATLFLFDASASLNATQDLWRLKVRWDWEADGVWDTDYSIDKTATRRFPSLGPKKIRDYRPDDIRKFISLDFTVQAADPALYQYLETLTSDLDVDLGTYTNIENGLGIFALTRRTELKGYSLDYKSMDSLMGGRWTKHLNFVNW